MIRIEAVWLATDPLDMRSGTQGRMWTRSTFGYERASDPFSAQARFTTRPRQILRIHRPIESVADCMHLRAGLRSRCDRWPHTFRPPDDVRLSPFERQQIGNCQASATSLIDAFYFRASSVRGSCSGPCRHERGGSHPCLSPVEA